MNEQERGPRLRLVQRPRRLPVSPDKFVEPASQSLLFPLPQKDLLIFLLFPGITEEEFTATLDYAKPAAILELRRSPRFDIGSLTRREAFQRFEHNHAKYYDLAPQSPGGDDSSWNPIALVEAFLHRAGSRIEGPVMLLVNDDPASENLATVIAQRFAAASKSPWKIYEIPQFA